jgi:hypothetical protein
MRAGQIIRFAKYQVQQSIEFDILQRDEILGYNWCFEKPICDHVVTLRKS